MMVSHMCVVEHRSWLELKAEMEYVLYSMNNATLVRRMTMDHNGRSAVDDRRTVQEMLRLRKKYY